MTWSQERGVGGGRGGRRRERGVYTDLESGEVY